MRLLFCHDGPMNIDNNFNAYPQNFNEEVIDRYYKIFGKFTMLIRTRIIDPKKSRYSKANMDKFKVVNFPNLSSIKGAIFNYREAVKVVKRELENSDFLIARLPSRSGFIAVELAKKMKKPYLIELVACPWDAHWNHSLKGKIVAPYMYYKTKQLVKNAPYVLYVTERFLQNRYPTKGNYVNCSDVSLNEFDNSVLEKRIKKIKSRIESEKMVIGTTAAVDVRYKGQQYIIEALGKLKKHGITNFEYQLVGGGDKSYLESVAIKFDVKDQVKFLGPKDHSDVFKWLDTIDIYVQPSRQEGLPRALVEAMSRGLPCFGADTGGIPELLDSKYIFSNTKRNIEEICMILKSMTQESMIEQAIRNFKVAQKYDKKIIDRRREMFFRNFVNNK